MKETSPAVGTGAGALEAAEQPVDELLRNLDLERLDEDLFLGDPGRGEGRLFGGMVAAQAVIAAGRSVEDGRRLHSLHSYFLRPGRHDVPLRFVVSRIRDGKTFTTRHVTAHQAGETIFDLSASFTRAETGLAHQDPMPESPGPEGLPDWEEERARVLGDPSARRVDTPIEVRLCDGPLMESAEKRPAAQRNWMRVRGRLPEDPLVHTAMLVYATDRTLLGHGRPAARAALGQKNGRQPRSLGLGPPHAAARRLAALHQPESDHAGRTRHDLRRDLHARTACAWRRWPRRG